MKEKIDSPKEYSPHTVMRSEPDSRTREMSPQDIANLIEKEMELHNYKIRRLLSLLLHAVDTLHLPETEDDES
tara:strand:+ start:149 stop:367 length:219 start_codon:yes stop_codon:yes gene_type:complete